MKFIQRLMIVVVSFGILGNIITLNIQADQYTSKDEVKLENKDNQNNDILIPLDFDYGIITSINISNTTIDEEGMLYLLYNPQRIYTCEVILNCDFEL